MSNPMSSRSPAFAQGRGVTATALAMLVLPVVYAYFGAEPARGAGSKESRGSR